MEDYTDPLMVYMILQVYELGHTLLDYGYKPTEPFRRLRHIFRLQRS